MEFFLEAKSIHIFAWPFMVEDAERKGVISLEEQLKEKGWTAKELDTQNMKEDSMESKKHAFMLKQYLSSSARKLYLDEIDKSCQVYEYVLPGTKEGITYHYCVNTKEKSYELLVDAVELHMYKYGIGILFLRTLNMDKTTSLADIKGINDIGRRIGIPYLPDASDGNILCSDSLELVAKKGNKVIKTAVRTDFRKRITDFMEADTTESRKALESRAEILDYLLNANLDGTKANDILVEPACDDRMFVISMIRDSGLSGKLADKAWRETREGEDELYAILYVDPSESTCCHEQMQKECLEQAGYYRWADYGTIYGATEYSFVGITTEWEGINASVVRPFYVEYTYMVSLVLAQRNALLMFSGEAAELASDMLQNKKRNGLIRKKVSRQLADLQELYIEFQNCMMLLEFSSQQQGIELYQLLQRQMLIEKEQGIIDNQLNGLYEIVTISNGTRANLWSTTLAILSFIEAILLALLPMYL